MASVFPARASCLFARPAHGGQQGAAPRMDEPARLDENDGLPPQARRRAIVTIAIAVAISVLSTAIANIALPTMAQELQASPAASIWVVNAYQLAVTVSLLPLASLGDIRGYKVVYLWGLVVFTVASVACGLADTLPLLVAARIAQGFGAAGIMSVNTALIRFIFPRSRLGQGIAMMGLIVAVSSASGPSLAAFILAFLSWHWLFLFNAPFGVLAVWLALRSLPATPRSGQKFDFVSAGLKAGSFWGIFLGLDGLELGIGIVSALVFIRLQRTRAEPMLPVDLFKLPIFALSVGTSVCSYSAQTIAYLALPFYFQVAGGFSQSHVGLLITPWPAVVVVIAPLSGRLSDKYSAGLLGGLGLAVLTVGLLLARMLPPDAAFIDVVWRMMVCGIGFGFFQSPNNRAIISAAPRHRSGAASGMLSTARLTGQTIGGVTVALLFAFTNGDIAQGVSLALLAGAVFSGVACGVSFLRMTQPAPV
jgi:DHA2 family multidrug resistance protein-like MFS transporter